MAAVRGKAASRGGAKPPLYLDLNYGILYIRSEKVEYLSMPKPSGKILVIRLSSLGDLILMMPMLSTLREGLPEARIELLVKERYAELFEESPYIDRLIAVRRGDIRELIELRSELARERYDTLIDAHNVIRSNVLFHSLHAPRKLQIRKNEAKKLLLIAGKINLYRRVTTQIQRYLQMTRSMGLDSSGKPDRLHIPPKAAARVDALLERPARGGGEIAAFAPGAHWETKRWPEEHFAELISLVSARGLRPVLIGGAEDAILNAALARQAGPAVSDLTGKLSIMESASVLARSAALVTNDSAPLHLAEAVGTPVVALFGPTVREFGYFPRLEASRVLETSLGCRPCSRNGKRPCPYGTKECLTAITPASAFEALSGVLAGRAVCP